MKKTNLQIGDRVRFLDAQGEGSVTRIINSSTVGVTTDKDDFELPYAVSALMKIEAPSSFAEQLFYKEQSFGQSEQLPSSTENRTIEKGIVEPTKEHTKSEYTENALNTGNLLNTEKINSSRFSQEEGVYLSFENDVRKQTDEKALFLINLTPYALVYQFVLCGAESYFSVAEGLIPSSSRKLIKIVPTEELGYWSEGYFQAIVNHDQNAELIPPFQILFKIPNRLLIAPNSGWVNITTLKDIKKSGIIHPESQTILAKKEDKISFGSTKQIPVIDLHIEHLSSTPESLSGEECLDTQLRVFETGLNHAISEGMEQIIFIHGIGKGILRSEMEKRLRNYKGLHFCNASSIHYGAGALEIFMSKPTKI